LRQILSNVVGTAGGDSTTLKQSAKIAKYMPHSPRHKEAGYLNTECKSYMLRIGDSGLKKKEGLNILFTLISLDFAFVQY
jgi:hypothetical protein